MQITRTKVYDRAIAKLLNAEEQSALEQAIAADPKAAPVIPGTGGIRKLRWAASGRGKRGGARVIYFFHDDAGHLFLLTAYAKADREDLTADDKKAWRKFVDAIKEASKP